MDLYFYQYNNYYNRIVKKLDSLSEYQTYQLGNPLLNVSFNPADDVNTTQVVNRDKADIGDYLICALGNEIVSRWFIIEANRERTGQYTLVLRRDVFADNLEEIKNAPAFIEKATLANTDPMIFNKEDMTFNQIKTSETPLQDETKSAWVVGYIPKDSFKENTTVNADLILDNSADITVDDLTNWAYYQYVNSNSSRTYFLPSPTWINYCCWLPSVFGNSRTVYSRTVNDTGNMLSNIFKEMGTLSGGQKLYVQTPYDNRVSYNSVKNRLTSVYPNSMYSKDGGQHELGNGIVDSANWIGNWVTNISDINTLARTYFGMASPDETTNFNNLNSKIIYESSTGMYYRIVVEPYNSKSEPIIENADTNGVEVKAGNLYDKLKELLNFDIPNAVKNGNSYTNLNLDVVNPTVPNNNFTVYHNAKRKQLRLEQIFVGAKTTLNNNRYHLEDQPYDMFCIPYSDSLKIYKNGTQILTANKSIAVNIATQIGAQVGSGNVYDVQLLPYCPVRYMIKSDGTFDIGTAKVHYITNNDNRNIGVICWATASSFTLDIPYTISVENNKIQGQTDMYRLCSPNYNGQFEFNAAMNGGVTRFNVDCSYMPYNPYIHINPDFGSLYGQDFNDARGLICGGDFSLPQTSTAWGNYQQNNKNYQAIFDRDIKNMEVNNSVQREREIWSAVSGTVSGAGSGALAGSTFGPIGAGIGALLGGAASAAAGARDVQLNDKLRNEAIDYRKDQFGYQLGNIKAMPTSISKTSPFTYNNKIFPILEYYTCTDREKQALKDKIKYNGMTVMRIGKIADYIQSEPSYIKGKIIRLEGLTEDFHYINAIADEFNKGVFI